MHMLVGRRAQPVVDLHAAAPPELQSAVLRELLPGPHAGGHHHELNVKDGFLAALVYPQALDETIGRLENLQGLGAGVDLDPEALDLALHEGACLGVNLHAQEMRAKLDDVYRGDLEIEHSLRSLQTQETTTNHGCPLCNLCMLNDRQTVLNCAIHKYTLGRQVEPGWAWRNEGLAPRREDKLVVCDGPADTTLVQHIFNPFRATVDLDGLAK
mmetsp:Transcript_38648/g.115440  ORF Transcript_38648/g.115440 Transcript_38648/m.115440 type:complete len:213 (+) Transcript_38648:1846-2484(+)